jgi:hypothetical protein
MRIAIQHLGGAILALAMAMPAAGQSAPDAGTNLSAQVAAQVQTQSAEPPMAVPVQVTREPVANVVEQLKGFSDAEVKFDLGRLMEILRDRRHEGWVLAAYPDPKTGQPLIGAGVSLDLPARDHPQRDPLNNHPFMEPSSAELWQAAGLDSERLKTILGQFDDRLAAWSKKGYRRRITALPAQISDDDAAQLLRVSIIQAIYNAKGYCREFDELTASQQMAMTQLVYQMGVNLAEFNQFLGLMNHASDGPAPDEHVSVGSDGGLAAVAETMPASDAEYWKTVQQSLVMSQWARLYRARAVAVIAMLDPRYSDGPGRAEQRVGAMLRPVAVERRKGSAVSSHAVSVRTTPRRHSRRPVKTHRQKKRGV